MKLFNDGVYNPNMGRQSRQNADRTLMSSSPINYSNMNKKAFMSKNLENCEDAEEGGVIIRSMERVPTTLSGVRNQDSRMQTKTKLAIASAGTMSPSMK
jgi:hypothetical protein